MPPIVGVYKLTKSEKFDEYLKALGLGYIERKMAHTQIPTITITQEGNPNKEIWEIKTVCPLKTTDIKFEIDQDFSETTADGRKCKTRFSKVGFQFVEKELCGKDQIPLMTTWDFSNEGLICVHKFKNVVCTRTYERLSPLPSTPEPTPAPASTKEPEGPSKNPDPEETEPKREETEPTTAPPS